MKMINFTKERETIQKNSINDMFYSNGQDLPNKFTLQFHRGLSILYQSKIIIMSVQSSLSQSIVH